MGMVLGRPVMRAERTLVDEIHALLVLLPSIQPDLWDEVMDQVAILRTALATFYAHPSQSEPVLKYDRTIYIELLDWMAGEMDTSPSLQWIVNRIEVDMTDPEVAGLVLPAAQRGHCIDVAATEMPLAVVSPVFFEPCPN